MAVLLGFGGQQQSHKNKRQSLEKTKMSDKAASRNGTSLVPILLAALPVVFDLLVVCSSLVPILLAALLLIFVFSRLWCPFLQL